MRTKEQIDGILAALEREYPMADCTLTERDAWRLLVQVRLAAQCTDKDPVRIEKALRAVLPPEKSNDFCHRLVLHGRAVCTARKPLCDICCCAAYCKTLNQ